MKNPIVELAGKELAWFEGVWIQDRNRIPERRIFSDRDNLYPIPFFGDIRRAEVLTLALNPADNEFDRREWPRRQIPTGFSATALASRMLHYFDLPEPEPHPFFEPFMRMLLPVGASYLTNSAHIDLSSLPTLKPSTMSDEQRSTFAEAVADNAFRLNEVLRLATNKKLILVADFRVGNGHGGHFSIWSLLCEHCPVFAQFARQQSDLFPILKRDNVGALTALVFQLRYEIREHLASASPMLHPNHE